MCWFDFCGVVILCYVGMWLVLVVVVFDMICIGNSDFDVFFLVFGGNVFGWMVDCDVFFVVFDVFVDGGGDFIDIVDFYSFWVLGNEGGESEMIIGGWLVFCKFFGVVVVIKVS